MKKILFTGGLLALCAASAFAAPAGVDISFNACPGDGGVQAGVIDCAGGGVLVGMVTFAPAEAITDLVAVDTIVDFFVQSPGADIGSNASFWDFQNANATGAGLAHLRPASGCATPVAFANTWNQSGAGTGLGALVTTPHSVRLAAGSFRPGNFSAAAGQNLFGYQLSLDGSTSVEAGQGGTGNGCSDAAIVVVQQAIPQSAAGSPTTTLTGPSNNPTPCTSINGGSQPNCAAVPTQRHTWSQLKSLYR